MEPPSYAPVQQVPVHSMDRFQYRSDLESEVESIARNPTVEPYNVTKSTISENTPAEKPDGGGGRRPGQTLRSSHASSAAIVNTPATPAAVYHGRSAVGNSNAPLQGAVVAFDISKAYSVICPATRLKGYMFAGFRSASAASPVATTSKPIMQRMVDREAAIATWLLWIGQAQSTILVFVDGHGGKCRLVRYVN